MQTLGWAAAGGIAFPFCMTSAGAAMVFFARPRARSEKTTLGFAAGVMTAASVWSLLLPAIERSEALGLPGWLPAAAGLLAGVVFLAAMDGWFVRLAGDRAGTALLSAAITLHNVPEGLAVGLAFALAAEEGSMAAAAALSLGIGIQNFPEGMAIALPLRQSGRSRLNAFAGGVLSGAVEPAAAMLAAALSARLVAVMPWLLAFAAGAMLYVVVEELVPQAAGRSGTCGFVAGFLAMMVLDVALG
ncbi:ZIP family metal transporter [Dysosmobacter sp.]|uniref:ZIP family metal transporter n=1 Tax=Dysosmobacter sp. TaxID=2591382 RepID=UPI002A89EAD1|nr:ZIP family metal transporter [Dysosmobacter sp.]MDY3281651.1 ZIP family metal transporter [Dysosmobacter sp.]